MNNKKNDSYYKEEQQGNIQMKPIYSTDEEYNCGIITYGNHTYLIDFKDRDNIINYNKSFVFVSDADIYPSFSNNYKRVTYLDFIFNYNKESVYYIFINKNQYDLRRCNVKIYHNYHKIIIEQYEILDYIPGHYLTNGQDANMMKNPLWRIKENEKEYLLMYCEKNTICKLCSKSYNVILEHENKINKKLTWYKCANGYIQTHGVDHGKNYYIHQIITGCYGNGKGTTNISVDHIDQNPLNNSFENLRIATREEQEQNSKGIKSGTKRERKYSAKPLPEGITQDMMAKYVCYYHEYLNPEHTKSREYFKIEKHPKLDKLWIGTKSNKVSIQDKLTQINMIVKNLEHDIYPEKNESVLPKYVSLVIIREKPHLVFEKQCEDKRLNLKMVLPEEYDLQEQIAIFNEKIKIKYNVIKIT